MSAAAVALAPAGAAPRRPAGLAVLLAACGACLAASAWSTDAFLVLAGAGFSAAVVRALVRRARAGLDAGDVFLYFVLYYALSLLLRGVGLLTFVDSPYLRELGDAHSERLRALVAWTFFFSALGLVAAEAGWDSRLGPRWAAALARRWPALVRPWRERNVGPTALGLVALGLAGAALRARSLGGFLGGADNPMIASTEAAVGRWWMIALTEFAVVGFHVHLIGLALRRDRRFVAHWLLLGLALGGPLYLMSSSKSLLLRVFFLPGLFLHFGWRPLPVWRVLAAIGAFLALFPLFYAYRSLGLLGLAGVRDYVDGVQAPLLLGFNRSYGADSFALILHRTPATLPFLWGRSLVDLFVYWVPRALWADKPLSFGLQFPSLYMPDMHWGTLTYATASLPGELYLDFHLPGVLAGCALLGAGMRAFHVLVRRSPGTLLVYGYVCFTAVHLVEGCIASQLETGTTMLLPAAIAIALLTRGGRAPAAGGAA